MSSRVLAVACVGLFTGASAVAAPTNEVSGACPGALTLTTNAATANGMVAFITGTLGGSTTLAAGPCPGLVLDLGGITKRFNGPADAAGSKTLMPNVQAGACAFGGQWMDITTCTVSPAVSLTPACTTTDESWGDIPPAAANMPDPALYSLWSEGIVDAGLRNDFTIDDPAGAIAAPSTLGIDFYDAAQVYMCSNFYNLSEATVHSGGYTAVTLDALGMVTMNAVAPLDAVEVVVTGGETTCGQINPAGALGTALGSDDLRVFGHTTWELAYNLPSADMDIWMSNAVGGAAIYAADWEPFIAGESYFGLEHNYVFTYGRTCDLVEVDAMGFLVQQSAPVGPLNELALSNLFGTAWLFSL